jgi:hypothetical protein
VVPSTDRVRQLASALETDAEYLNLLAGRVPHDVMCSLQRNPKLIAQLRNAAS